MKKKKYEEKYSSDVFGQYKEIDYNDDCVFNIIHLYDTKDTCYPDGYHDARWMTVKCYNTEEKTFFELKRKQDSLTFHNGQINFVRIFVDGSTCLVLSGKHRFNGIFQASDVVKVLS